jgi:hypothetical protein
VIPHIPKTADEVHLWCLFSAATFLIISFINHVARGQLRQFGSLVAIKQSISGLMFPYSILMILLLIDKSLLQTIGDVERFLSIAGIALTILSISALFKVG